MNISILKTRIYAVFFVLGVLFSIGSTRLPESTKNTAEVKKYSNIYVFIDSEPVNEYKELGTVEIKMVSDCSLKSVREKLIKKALKEYPDAHGIIINDEFEASVIKFE